MKPNVTFRSDPAEITDGINQAKRKGWRRTNEHQRIVIQRTLHRAYIGHVVLAGNSANLDIH